MIIRSIPIKRKCLLFAHAIIFHRVEKIKETKNLSYGVDGVELKDEKRDSDYPREVKLDVIYIATSVWGISWNEIDVKVIGPSGKWLSIPSEEQEKNWKERMYFNIAFILSINIHYLLFPYVCIFVM